jgi:opacity protein-like surface antigen
MRVFLVCAFASLSAACASVSERHVPAPLDSGVADAVSAPAIVMPATPAVHVPMEPREFHFEPHTDFAAPPNDSTLGTSYTALRLGAFDPQGDISSLDSGIWGEVAFGRRILGVLGVEAVLGYFETEGNAGAEIQGVPLLINARLSVPVLILEPYAGAGLGGLWANAKAGGFSSEDTFSTMWDAFIGIEVGLAGFSIGAEYRYVQTGDLDNPGGVGDFQAEGNVFLLTGRLPF